MTKYQFHDEFSLSEIAVKLGKRAMDLGLIQSFVVHYFPDSQQFYISGENKAEPYTPEEAYMRLKKLVEQSEKNPANLS